MSFVKLTFVHKDLPVWLNVALIESIMPGKGDESVITMAGAAEDNFYTVKESPKDILYKISYACT